MHDSTDPSDTPRSPRDLVIAIVLTGALFALLVPVLTGRSGPPSGTPEVEAPALTGALAWPALRADARALEAARQRFHGGAKAPPQALIDTLFEAARAINDHDFETHPIPAKTERELEQGLEGVLQEVATRSSVEGFAQVGEPLFRECLRSLEALLSDVRGGNLTLDQATRDPDIGRYASYRQSCGNVLGVLRQHELIDDQARWTREDGPELAHIMMRYRWVQPVSHLRAPNQLMPAEELLVMHRLLIESPHAFPAEQRLRLLNATRASLPYPYQFGAALISLDAGQTDEALRQLEVLRRAQPDHPHVAAWIAQVSQRASKNTP